MNYTLTPSLKHIALVKIATTLWNQGDIRALIAKFRGNRRAKWQELENKVIEKVPQLSLPDSLKEEILGFYIQPIGEQILIWVEYHDRNLNIDLPNYFCWTPQGTVDNKRTAEALIKDESLDIIKRYRLACTYCLRDDIPELWDKIPENDRTSFDSKYEDHLILSQHALVDLWTYDVKGEVANFRIDGRMWRSPYQYAFEYAAFDGNKTATEYFLKKLTSREREESLVNTTGNVAKRGCVSGHYRGHCADVVCFLLSQMDEEQQIEVFKSYSFGVLMCLLDWPWQSLFMQTANRVWDFLSEEHYNCVLGMMINKVVDGCKDCYYQKLFGEFWQQSPNAHRRYVIDKCATEALLSKLFKIESVENIKLILKDATFIEKNKLIFSNRGKDICLYLIYGDKWNLLKFFVQECISSNDMMVKFKEELRELLSEEKLEREKDLWSKFFQLLDDLFKKDDKKRCKEEGNFSPSKRLHSMEFEEVTHSMQK